MTIIIHEIKNDEHKIKEILGINFFSVSINKPASDNTIPTVVRKIVIASPIEFPTCAICVGETKTIKNKIIPVKSAPKLIKLCLFSVKLISIGKIIHLFLVNKL